MAKGRVLTGYSHPMAATYNNTDGNVTYTNPFVIARGVSVDVSLTTSLGKTFYADNGAQETSAGKFVSGNLNLVNDDPLPDTAAKIYGLPKKSTQTVGNKDVSYQGYGDAAKYPYLGVSVIMRYQEDGTDIFVPVLFTKVRFSAPNTRAETQGEEINYQTTELNGSMAQDDTPDKNWKRIYDDCATEAEAIAVQEAILGKTAE